MMEVGTNVRGDEVHSVILKPALKKKFYSLKITLCDPFMTESQIGKQDRGEIKKAGWSMR